MIEIEAKFPDIDPDALRSNLLECGYVCTKPEALMRRKIFERDPEKHELYARVRDEGHRITMTIKNVVDNTIHGVQESEVIINDFDQGVLFLEMAGWTVKSYQETKREVWHRPYDNVEVMIDTWPGIPTFCEIEASSEEAVRKASVELGFNWKNALFGAVDTLYWHHLKISGKVINSIPVITFAQPVKAQ